jgi:hypothetical protein
MLTLRSFRYLQGGARCFAQAFWCYSRADHQNALPTRCSLFRTRPWSLTRILREDSHGIERQFKGLPPRCSGRHENHVQELLRRRQLAQTAAHLRSALGNMDSSSPRAQFIELLYIRYLYVLEHQVHSEYEKIRAITIQYRNTCIKAFGASVVITVKALIELANVCMRSEKHIHEAISYYEEV